MSLENETNLPDLICLSHLRWNFVWQRPQHLLSRFARHRRVFFIEEPIGIDEDKARLEINQHESGVYVVVPHIPHAEWQSHENLQRAFVDELLQRHKIDNYFLWFYTPMAMGFADHLEPLAVVYDCMDELSAFRNAPQTIKDREKELFRRAHLVFTGGESLYEAKKEQHERVYAFPSSIEVEHFAKARNITVDPADQQSIAHPRLGFFGVVDERFDINLLDRIAELRPDWQFVIIGPVVKISESDLPRRANIHYLGGKSYQELPNYIAGWDVALLLFALNESTRFISPTKTPEYLAAGCPVVSTPIRDVVRPYGEMGLVHIADTPEGFVQACEEALKEDRQERLNKVDLFLAKNSWDKTFEKMADLVDQAVETRKSEHNGQVENARSEAEVNYEKVGQ